MERKALQVQQLETHSPVEKSFGGLKFPSLAAGQPNILFRKQFFLHHIKAAKTFSIDQQKMAWGMLR